MDIKTMLTILLMAAAMSPANGSAQMPMPGVNSLLPDKAALLEQGKKLVADLLTLKQDPKLPAADRGKVDALLPKANALNAEIAKPQLPPNKLTELAGQLTDLQKQVATIKATALR